MDQLNAKKESNKEIQDKKLLAENIFLKTLSQANCGYWTWTIHKSQPITHLMQFHLSRHNYNSWKYKSYVLDDLYGNVEAVGERMVHGGEGQLLDPELGNLLLRFGKLFTEDLGHRVRLLVVDQHLQKDRRWYLPWPIK